MMVSKCHNAAVTTRHAEGGESWYECYWCGRPTDVYCPLELSHVSRESWRDEDAEFAT